MQAMVVHDDLESFRPWRTFWWNIAWWLLRQLRGVEISTLLTSKTLHCNFPDGFAPTAQYPYPDAVTLGYARRMLTADVQEGATCPCCTQFAKVYARTITSSMAYALIMIHKRPGAATDDPALDAAEEAAGIRMPSSEPYFHVPDYLSSVCKLGPTTRGGDWAKLTAWGLIEEQEGKREDGSSRTGFYRITDKGRAFVKGAIPLPKHALFYDGTVLRLDASELIFIKDALGKKFSYEELMAPAPSGLTGTA